MATHLQQAQQEGLCLRYPEQLPNHREVTYENALNMLIRGTQLAATVPFTWSFIEGPKDGTVLLLFLPRDSPFPNDGIRWLDSERTYTIPVGNREIEIGETKYGFIPNLSTDTAASRFRRRYRLTRGGSPQLWLVHYTRGPTTHVPPNMLTQPIRAYPLRPVSEPSIYVLGEKVGQKVYPPGTQMHQGPPPMPPVTIGLGMNYNQQQAMLAQQNNNMEELERRRARERERERAAQRNDPNVGTRPPPPRIVDEDESGDEIDQISARTLAMARYKRNHDWMNEVFSQAAFGKLLQEPKPSPYSIFSLSDLDEKTAKLQAEIDTLQSKSDQRRADRIRASQTNQMGEVSISAVGNSMTE